MQQRAQKYSDHYLNSTALDDVRLYFHDDFRLLGYD